MNSSANPHRRLFLPGSDLQRERWQLSLSLPREGGVNSSRLRVPVCKMEHAVAERSLDRYCTHPRFRTQSLRGGGGWAAVCTECVGAHCCTCGVWHAFRWREIRGVWIGLDLGASLLVPGLKYSSLYGEHTLRGQCPLKEK